jgi:hypothetical protein
MTDIADPGFLAEDGRLHLNGIDALTGLPVVPPMTKEEAATRAAGGPPPVEDVGLLRRLWEALKRPFHGLPDDIKPTDVTAAGWAVVVPTGTPDQVREAIEQLVAHRRDYTRVPADRCRILDYRARQSLTDWLRGLGAHLADVEPDRLPYYVALVGGPEVISFEFQTLLDMKYAVGWIAFDRPEQYRNYVEGLIAYETAGVAPNGREVLYWGPRNQFDRSTDTLVLLARNSSFNSVVDPVTARPRDMTKYYAAWVTPNIEPVQALVRKAAERVPGRCFWGYQAQPKPDETATQVKAQSRRQSAGATPTRSESTAAQVKALFDTLKEAGIVYVDSVIDFGAGPGQFTQRTRLPRESLKHRSANCIDGTVLFASLLEFASLHAAIVLVPGHAFVGWETWRGADEWDYLETTMIGSADFETARQHARKLFQQFAEEDLAVDDGPIPRVLKLNDLRAQGIWPME